MSPAGYFKRRRTTSYGACLPTKWPTLTPIAGNLITRGYSRSEEFAADRHGVEILRRAGYSKQVMIDALDWISRTGGGTGGGGFLSTHPATAERIQELRRMT
jgi:predicted Zn-dependent protease